MKDCSQSYSSKKRFEKYKKILLEIIYSLLPECQVYLFGSRARCDHTEGSDIDLALDAKEPIKLETIHKIKDKIEESIIPLFVDLVDINSAGKEIRKRIEKEGMLWKN